MRNRLTVESTSDAPRELRFPFIDISKHIFKIYLFQVILLTKDSLLLVFLTALSEARTKKRRMINL
jgi:hypothetical protein